MAMHMHAIPPPLRPYLCSLWSLEEDSEAGPGSSPPLLILPDGCVEIVVHHGAPWTETLAGLTTVHPRSFVTAQLAQPLTIQGTGAVGFISARATALGAYHLFGPRMTELAGATTPLQALWPDAHRLEDEVCAAHNAAGRSAVLARHLLAHLARNERHDTLVDGAVSTLLHQHGAPRISDVARSIGAGERQLNRRFTDRVGLSPKVFASIIRFRHAARTVQRMTDADLLEVALQCGYYDLSHMGRDFRRFAGMEPSALAQCTDVYL